VIITNQANTGAATKIASALELFWKIKLPSIPKPDREQFLRWLRIHQDDGSALRYGIKAAEKRLLRVEFGDANHPITFISAVALAHVKTRRRNEPDKKAA
jgi:hypothetical protein